MRSSATGTELNDRVRTLGCYPAGLRDEVQPSYPLARSR